jgi:hypothetical protein
MAARVVQIKSQTILRASKQWTVALQGCWSCREQPATLERVEKEREIVESQAAVVVDLGWLQRRVPHALTQECCSTGNHNVHALHHAQSSKEPAVWLSRG